MKPLKLCFALISILCFTSVAVADQDDLGPQSAGACEYADLIATGMMVKFDLDGNGRLDLRSLWVLCLGSLDRSSLIIIRTS